jgi:hypothetical protein
MFRTALLENGKSANVVEWSRVTPHTSGGVTQNYAEVVLRGNESFINFRRIIFLRPQPLSFVITANGFPAMTASPQP